MEFSILDNCEGEDFAIVCQLIFDLIFLTGFEPDLEGFISRLTFSSPKYFALFKQELIIYLYQKKNLVHSNIEIKLWILCGLEWNLMKINLTRLFGAPTFFVCVLKQNWATAVIYLEIPVLVKGEEAASLRLS